MTTALHDAPRAHPTAAGPAAGGSPKEPRGPRGPGWPGALVALLGAAFGVVVVGGSTLGSVVRLALVAAGTAASVAVLRGDRHGDLGRGLVAVSAGVVGLVVGGAIGVSFTARAGLSAEGAAGLVCLVAGAALLIWGTVQLVRRVHGWRRVLALPIAFVVLQFVAVPLFGALVITNVPRDEVEATTPADRGLPYEDVSLTTPDGVALAGWYVPSRNGAAVVVLAGSGSTRSGAVEPAAVLARHGYGALVIDNRGHGRSGGTAMDAGWFGDDDIAGALGYLQGRDDLDAGRLGVVGLSMGGEEAIGAAARDTRIRAVVAEGATGRDAADHEPAAGLEGLIERVTSWEQFALADALTDAHRPTPLREAAAQARAPMLLIAGRGEVEANRALQRAASGSVELWELPQTAHIGARAERPVEWEARVVGFLDRTLASG